MVVESSGSARVALAYGRKGTSIARLGTTSEIVLPRVVPPLADPEGAVAAALRAPLGALPLAELARGRRRIVISICDGTRAQPRRTVLPPLIDVLEEVAPEAEITLLVATGTHRANTPAELEEMLGAELLARTCVVNHDARDPDSLVALGTYGEGVELLLDRRWVDADLRLTTGFVEPHFFAGFSGGPKMVVPGLAGLDTVMRLHDATRIGDARATFGEIDQNPVHADIRALAGACPPDLALDVLLDREQRITHVFCGEMFAMHAAACAAALEIASVEVATPAEIVVTTCSGYPLDQSLYQAVKGLAAAARVVRPGGLILLAAACEDGLPAAGPFAELLGRARSPQGLLDLIAEEGFAAADQWQVQILAQVLCTARVRCHSDGLADEELRAAFIEPAGDLDAALAEEIAHLGGEAHVCYLPEGPQCIPRLAPRR